MSSLSRLVGTVIAGRYRIDRPLAEGGMGAVFEATQLSLSRKVAIKVVKPTSGDDAERIKRFEIETQAIARLQHPHIVHVIDAGSADDGMLYLAMELLEGENVRQALRREGPLHWQSALTVAEGVTSALVAAHAAGVIHRDLKAENVLLWVHPGSQVFAKVLDFGVAKLTSEVESPAVTGSGFVAGTPGFIAPEQIVGTSDDPRSDLYSLGVMLFEMLSGRAPFSGKTGMELMLKHLNEPAPQLSLFAPERYIPAKVDALVMGLLSKDPGLRPPSAKVLLEVLRDLRDNTQRTTPERGSAPRPRPAPPRAGRDIDLSLGAQVGSRIVALDPTLDQVTLTADGVHAPAAPTASLQPTPMTSSTNGAVVAAAPRRSRLRVAALAGVGVGLLAVALTMLWPSHDTRLSDNVGAQRHLDNAVEAYWDLDTRRLWDETQLALENDPNSAMAHVLRASAIWIEPGSLARADRELSLAQKAKPAAGRVRAIVDLLSIADEGRAEREFRARVSDGSLDPLQAQLFASKQQCGRWSDPKIRDLLAHVTPPSSAMRAATAVGYSRAARYNNDRAQARAIVIDQLTRTKSRLLHDELLEIELADGQVAQAQARTRQTLASDRSDMRAAIRAATFSARDGRRDAFDTLLNDVRGLPTHDPRRVDALSGIAMQLAALGRLAEADALWVDALKQESDPARAMELTTLAPLFTALLQDEPRTKRWLAQGGELSFSVDVPEVRARCDLYLRAVSVLLSSSAGSDERAEQDLQAMRTGDQVVPLVVTQTGFLRANLLHHFDDAEALAQQMPPCWKEPNSAAVLFARARAVNDTDAWQRARDRLLDVTKPTDESACGYGTNIAPWLQAVLFARSLANLAVAEQALNNRAGALQATRRYRGFWPSADSELVATRDVAGVETWLARSTDVVSVPR